MTSDKEDDGKSAGLHFTSRFSVGAAPDPLPETPAFRALIIGDFGATRDLGRPIRIDEDTIESLPERLGVSLEVETPNLLSSDQHPVVETLTLERLRDVLPAKLRKRFGRIATADALAASNADLGPEGYDRLLASLRPAPARDPSDTNGDPFADTGTASSGDGSGDLDRLLGMVDAPNAGTPKEVAHAAVTAFIKHTLRTTSTDAPRTAEPTTVPLIDEQLAADFADERLRSVVENWAALRLMLRQIDLHAGFTVDLCSAPDTEIEDTLARVVEAEINASDGRLPYGIVLVARRYRRTSSDFDRLAMLAEIGEALQGPVLTSFAPTVFADKPPSEIARLDAPAALMDHPDFDAWRGLQGREASRWLSVFWNDMLLSSPESGIPALWGQPAWAGLALVLRSVEETGWPSEILGSRRALDDLSVHEVELPGQRAVATAVSGFLMAEPARNLAGAGVVALAGQPDRDTVLLFAAPTVFHRSPGRGETTAQADAVVDLSYQLVAARIAALLGDALPELTTGRSGADAAAAVERWLTSLALTTGDGARARVELEENDGLMLLELVTGTAVLNRQRFAFEVPV